jgi:hypothetical protein
MEVATKENTDVVGGSWWRQRCVEEGVGLTN